jgi:hypothetical protein
MIDYVKPAFPLPPSSLELAGNISNTWMSLKDSTIKDQQEPINQLTINEYWPNQGIAAHIGI